MRILELLAILLHIQASADVAVTSLRGAQRDGAVDVDDLPGTAASTVARSLQTIQDNTTLLAPNATLLHDFGNITTPNATEAPVLFAAEDVKLARARKVVKTLDKAKGTSIENNPILPAVHDYPAQGGQFGPTFKLGSRMDVLFTNARWATIRFGNPDGKWLEIKFDMKPPRIQPQDYAKYGIDPTHFPPGHKFYAGITVTTSQNPQPQWWDDYAEFLHTNYAALKKGAPGVLALDLEFLAKGKPDDGGQTYSSDFYGINTPGAYDKNHNSFDPAYFTDVGYTGGKSFPWNKIPYWVGGGYHSDALPDSFANSLGNQVSFAVSPGGAVEVSRSQNDARLPVPEIATRAPTRATKAPTKKTDTAQTKHSAAPTAQPTKKKKRKGL